jgi:hypothetical protein
MKGVVYIGPDDEYGSSVPWDGGRSIVLREGWKENVSDEKAAQMGDDFPEWFEFSDPFPEDELVSVQTVVDASRAAGDEDGNDGEESLESRIAAVSSHADANALAEELGVEGFEAKKPNLDAKRAALLEAAQAAAADAEEGEGDDGEPAA